MRKLIVYSFSLTVIVFLSISLALEKNPLSPLEKKQTPSGKSRIQVALLIDTSNSMDDFLQETRTQLLKILDILDKGKKKGKDTTLDVALFEYGKSTLPPRNGYSRMVLPFTNDLEKISEEFQKLETCGGEERCGQIIQRAVHSLKWSKSNRDYKVIFIVGNEPFDQGEVNYREACKKALKRGIIVNSVYWGLHSDGIKKGWATGARIASGEYINLLLNVKAVQLESPFDKDIIKLGKKLQDSYIPFGKHGLQGKRNQMKDDNFSTKSQDPVSQLHRAVALSDFRYEASNWDLVDAVKLKSVKLGTVKSTDLPKEMKTMTLKQKKDYITGIFLERQRISFKIRKLNEKRRAYVRKNRKMFFRHIKIQSPLEKIMVKTIEEQLKKKGFQISK